CGTVMLTIPLFGPAPASRTGAGLVAGARSTQLLLRPASAREYRGCRQRPVVCRLVQSYASTRRFLAAHTRPAPALTRRGGFFVGTPHRREMRAGRSRTHPPQT